MNELVELLKVAGIGIAVWLITTVLKQSKMETAASVVSIMGVVVVLLIAANYILQFLDVVETMFTF